MQQGRQELLGSSFPSFPQCCPCPAAGRPPPAPEPTQERQLAEVGVEVNGALCFLRPATAGFLPPQELAGPAVTGQGNAPGPGPREGQGQGQSRTRSRAKAKAKVGPQAGARPR